LDNHPVKVIFVLKKGERIPLEYIEPTYTAQC